MSAHEQDDIEMEEASGVDQENAAPQHPSVAVPASQASYVPQETRLVINKIVLENFKSYAGRQEIGPLHHCFSAVVGPNGSGKSNVIDAVLFVFGRQAKKLRLNKVSEFIHNSEHQRNLTSAKVSVHFEEIYVDDDDQVSRPVPGSKFVLSRTAKADNSSDYYMDNKKLTRDKVVEILKKKGVDLDNSRFLILQGEVEQISLMKPKGANPNETGLVDYLEEIIGSNKYIEDIEKMTKSVDELTEERRGKMARVDVAEKECKRLEGAKNEAESCITKQRELLDARAILAQLHRHREAAKAESDLEKKREAEQVAKKELDRMYDEIKETTRPLLAKLESVKTEQMPHKREATQAEAKLARARQEHNSLSERAGAAKRQAESAQNDIATLTQQLATIREESAEKKELVVQKREELQEKRARLPALEKQNNDLSTQLQELHQQRAELEHVNSETSTSTIVRALMDAKNKGQLPGVYGRLGDLGFIDDKYDVAISTACPALNNIVVDTAETGTKCIDILRKGNLGRATFIIIDQVMKHVGKNMSAPFHTPQGSQRLYDLVEMKDQTIRPAFYHALRDTLVTESFEVARKIAYSGKSGYRVVTLEGELFEKTGTMSGGGSQKFSGGMRSAKTFVDPKENEQKLKKLFAEIDKVEKAREKVRSELASVKDDIVRLEREVARLIEDNGKTDFETKSISTQLEQLKKRLPELQAESKASKEELARLETLSTEIAKLEKECEKWQKVLSKSEEEIKNLTREIDEVGGTDLKVQKSRVESLSDRIQALSNQQSAAQQKAKRAEKKANEMEQQREEAEGVRDAAIKKLEKKKNQDLEKLVNEASEVFTKFESARKEHEEHSESISSLREQFEEARTAVAELRRDEAKLADEVNKVKKAIDERDARIRENDQKLSHIKKEKLQTKIDEETDESLTVPEVTEEQVDEHDEQQIIQQIQLLKQELAATEPDRAAIRAWRERKKVLEERQAELDEVSKRRDAVKKELDDLRKKRFDEFMTGFNVISTKLREMYRMITLGGDAELEVIDLLDPFSEGVNFTVRPPGKSWKKIQNLSGGEKTLSSLSLVFALHYYKPTPIYIMDEIDAALDFKNVSIVANYIKERTKNAQFLIVSLRNYMFELADRLVGIYKTDNCTKSVTINPHAFQVQTTVNQ